MNRSLISSYMVNFFGMGSGMTMIFHLSLYFQAAKGMSAGQVGLWLLPNVLGGVVGSLAGGLIMQASGKYYWLVVSGYWTLFVGSVVLVLMTGVVVHSMAGIVVGLVVSGFGNGTFHSSWFLDQSHN